MHYKVSIFTSGAFGVAQDFSHFEQGIELIAGQLPGMPQDRVVLNRLFFFVFRELNEIYDHHLQDHGLNTSSFLVLVMLLGCAGNRLNPSDLSNVLIASRTNVTRLTDELVSGGWLTRNPSREDRRRIDLSLTPSGRERILAVLPRIWALVERQWAGFSHDELVTFERLMRKMRHSLSCIREDG